MGVDLKLEGKEIAKAVTDLFSPLTEFAGAIGDQIRIYRQLSVLRTLERARSIAKEEGLQLNAPPLKFLVPFLEQSSLEHDQDSTLLDLWANLLVSSSTNFRSEHNLFVRILGELSPKEAKAFQFIANSPAHARCRQPRHLEDVESDWEDSYGYITIRDLLEPHATEDLGRIDHQALYEELLAQRQCPGSIINYFSVAHGIKHQFPYESIWDSPRLEFDDFERVTISLLISLGLIGRFESPEYWFGAYMFEFEAYYLTPLGARFYEACVKGPKSSGEQRVGR